MAHVVLNRPHRRNALTGPLAEELLAAVEGLNEDPSVSVVVLRGAEGAFCSGLDLKEFGADPQPDWVAGFGALWGKVHVALFDSPKIIVGALERAAVNGGAALAIACDFLIAGDTAFLQVGEIQQGMAAPMNMAWLRLRHSEATAARLTLLGDRIAGPDLVNLGIALQSVPDAEVVDTAQALAERLAEHEPVGVTRIKRSLRTMGPASSAQEWFQLARDADPIKVVGHRPQAATDS